MIPEILSIPVYYSSQWTRIVFFFREENHYAGGLIPNLPYYIFFYAAIFVISNFIYLRNNYNVNKANMKKEGPAIDYVDPRVQ